MFQVKAEALVKIFEVVMLILVLLHIGVWNIPLNCILKILAFISAYHIITSSII